VVVLLPLLVTAPSTLPAQQNAKRRRLSHDVATAVVKNLGRDWFFAVDHVRFVYELLDDRIRMCQARMVADFLSVTARTAALVTPAIATDTYALHAPITECSVCRQSLGRGRRDEPEARLSGEFIVQCVRCGHGGHLQHMLEWAASPLSRGLGCPAGCECNCAY
jgi:hypothetical protein